MEEKTYRLGRSALSLPAEDADKLIALGDGDCALLYLQVLRSGGTLTPALAAKDLGKSENDIRALASRLSRAGIGSAGEAPLPGPEELPSYSPEELTRRAETDGAFHGLVEETKRVMGHALSGADLQTLFGIYDRLGLTPEAIMLLINHQGAELRRRYGEGRLPTMHRIEQEAFRWAREEILTAPQAEEYIARRESMHQELERVRECLQLRDRALSPTERKYLDGWLELGFTSEVIAQAYDRTVVSTGKLTWPYMDKILRSWAEHGLFTPEAVEKGDPRKGSRTAAGTPAGQSAGARKDDTRRLLEKMQGGK